MISEVVTADGVSIKTFSTDEVEVIDGFFVRVKTV